jgi:hypothetical protein
MGTVCEMLLPFLCRKASGKDRGKAEAQKGECVTVDFKQPRISEDREGWEDLRRAKLGPCRVCGATSGITLHHVISRSQLGDDVEFNLVPLCGSGVTGCHGRIEAGDKKTRCALRQSLTLDELAYVYGKKGPTWLDWAYPWSAE